MHVDSAFPLAFTFILFSQRMRRARSLLIKSWRENSLFEHRPKLRQGYLEPEGEVEKLAPSIDRPKKRNSPKLPNVPYERELRRYNAVAVSVARMEQRRSEWEMLYQVARTQHPRP